MEKWVSPNKTFGRRPPEKDRAGGSTAEPVKRELPFPPNVKYLENRLTIAYSFGMKTEAIAQIRKFIPGARPPKKLSAADVKQLEEAVPSIKARELAARFAKSKVKVNP